MVRPQLLDPHREEIKALLLQDQKITAKRIGRILEPKAGRIKPRTLRQYVARLRAELFAKEAFVHRTHRPGHTMEADFGESWAVIAGAGLLYYKIREGSKKDGTSFLVRGGSGAAKPSA